MSRLVVHFSCGAASAVAAKIIVSGHQKRAQPGDETVLIVNAFIKEEHADNRRFLDDVAQWLEYPIKILRDEKYGASTLEVFRRRRFMKNGFLTPCSYELKRKVLGSIAMPGDITVIGYTIEEEKRAEHLEGIFPNETFLFPLIRDGLCKADCLAIVERAGLVLPAMYRLGYNNANCIGCVKGGEGYWNKIRRDFPEEFIKIADIQKSIGPGANLFRDRKTGVRYSLYDLPFDKGRYQEEPEISCSFFCALVEREFSELNNEDTSADLGAV